MSQNSHWQRYQQYLIRYTDLGFSLDVSRMAFPDDFLSKMAPACEKAVEEMQQLEAGEIVNVEEQRMVGHYWLRNPKLAPNEELRKQIESEQMEVIEFATGVHEGWVRAANGNKFTDLLLIGIGGSALGPQLVSDSLTGSTAPLAIHFFDNTDPDGQDRVLARIGSRLSTTLTVVISKSGGTKETRNGMLEAEAAYKARDLNFARHAVAVTGVGSQLDKHAIAQGWIKRFPMSDWIGGRTSVMSTVGLVPAALQGVNLAAFLEGAAHMDAKTRSLPVAQNASMMLALMWYHAGNGRGTKDMVILPYKDRLLLLSKYLQQLVMESLGKELDRDGNVVHQGIAVYGNKGSTDQHAYVQQLRDGVNNFFATFIEIREDREGTSMEVEPGFTTGDYLQGFFRGTRKALAENARESITLSLPKVDAYYLGLVIALFERAVGFYASLVNINAYHQPGVEAGKKAAGDFIDLLGKVRTALAKTNKSGATAEQIAKELSADAEDVYHCLIHAVSNASNLKHHPGTTPAEDLFSVA